MASLFRNSRFMLTHASCIRRAAGTTSTSSGTPSTQPSGASGNLSQASRSADGTDMAMRDAKQRGTLNDPIKPKPAGESSHTPQVGTSLNTWGKIGFGVILAISSYFIYINYIKNPEFSKSLKLSKEASKRDAHEQQSVDRDAASSKKH
ncbi:unnamed protein product [Adineta steineri]|uniref:Uncharacterized protein n=1 Tax=Adineta steineri TaxID=433720 RepID=A0A814NHC1_9BILA|nr:unnamed protein product [Adineta steineri]CAF1091594.1 unnamed protein product [Adineta steineri]CAF1384945.1 unnamed protein product [Adineta steineri]CAF3638699.1 unnamed protein product [Adineta steineri]